MTDTERDRKAELAANISINAFARSILEANEWKAQRKAEQQRQREQDRQREREQAAEKQDHPRLEGQTSLYSM